MTLYAILKEILKTQRMIRKDDKGEKGKEKSKEKILTQKVIKSLGIG